MTTTITDDIRDIISHNIFKIIDDINNGSDTSDLVKFINTYKNIINLNIKGKKGRTPLMLTSFNNNSKLVKLLIVAGAELNIRDITDGDTALINASYKGNTEIVQLLIDAGADLYIRNHDGKDALYYAKKRNRPDCVKILEEAMKKSANKTANNILSHALNNELVNLIKEMQIKMDDQINLIKEMQIKIDELYSHIRETEL